MRLFKYPYGTGKRYRYEIEIGGVVKSPHEWARETGIAATTLVSRAKKGWLDKDMLVPPLPKGGAIKGAEGIVFDRMENNETLCWRCQKSTGGCRWSQRLEPVEIDAELCIPFEKMADIARAITAVVYRAKLNGAAV